MLYDRDSAGKLTDWYEDTSLGAPILCGASYTLSQLREMREKRFQEEKKQEDVSEEQRSGLRNCI